MAYTEFYVTKGASVSDVNGGGPRLGADDGPTYTLTGGGGAGATATDNGADSNVEDLNNGSWGDTAVDDWLCFDTAGVKEIARVKAIDVGADADVITVTPQLTAAADKTCRVCGAWATVDHSASVVTTSFVNAAGDPPRTNIKYNAAAYAEDVTIDNDGTSAIRLAWEGYESTAGDGCPNGNWPTIAGTGHAFLCQKTFVRFRYGYVTTAGANGKAVYVTGTGCSFAHIKAKATGTGTAIAFFLAAGFDGYDLWAEDSTAEGFYIANAHGIRLVGCRSDSAGTYAFYFLSGISVCIDCIANAPTDDCYYVGTYAVLLHGCTGYGSVGGSGVRLDDSTHYYGPTITNCTFEGNNQYGIECDVSWDGHEDHNGFYNNTQGNRLNVVQDGANDVEQSAGSFFVNAAGGDFRLNATAGQGALLRTTGFPGTLLDGTNIGYRDIGGLQHEDAGSGTPFLVAVPAIVPMKTDVAGY